MPRPAAAPAASPWRLARHQALWPSAQQELMLTAAVGGDAEAAAAFARWADHLDIEGVFDRATYRLLPLVSARMRQLGVTHLLTGRLTGVYRRVWYETHQLFHAIAPVVAALEARGIQTMLLKGAPLVLSHYRNHAVRPMSDIDVVVRPQAARQAMAVLRELGWTRVDTAADEDLLYRHAMLFRDAAGLELDLHWHFMSEACNAEADAAFWDSATPLDFAGVPTRQPDASLLLVHIVIHGMRFNSEPTVRWIADALAVLRGSGAALDWPRMLAFAQDRKLTHRLGLGLGYLAEVWAAPVPAEALARLRACRPSLVERIENTVVFRDMDRMFTHPLTKQWIIFADYCRCAPAANPFGFVLGFPEYVRYRWRVPSRRQIAIDVVRGSLRRLRRAWR